MDLKKNQNMQKGFTLIELLITVVIMGILVSLAAPSMFQILEGRKLKGATENLFADLMFAKTETIKRNNKVILSFTAGTNWCYGLSEDTGCNCATSSPACTIDGIEKIVTSDGYGDTSIAFSFFGGTTTETGFEPLRGFAENASGATSNGSVKFTNGGREAVVMLSTLGRVRICSDTGFGGYKSC